VFSGVAWPSLGGRGYYNMVSELQFSKMILDEPINLTRRVISQRIDFEVAKFQVTECPW
jgi:hypothetical protein